MSLIVPYPEVVPSAYWPQFTAFVFSYSMGRTLLSVVESLALSPRSAHILIVGAWGGRDYFWLRSHGFTPETLDIVDHPWGESTYRGDACERVTWEQISSPYDLIIMCDVLEHLPRDFDALVFARRALKETGHLWLSVPYRLDRETTHVRAYSPLTLERLLACAGFVMTHTEPRPGYLAAFPRLVNGLNYLLALMMPTTSMGARLLFTLLWTEQRANRRWCWISRLVGGVQAGRTCLCAPSQTKDITGANELRFAQP
jgi:hypothetical protein